MKGAHSTGKHEGSSLKQASMKGLTYFKEKVKKNVVHVLHLSQLLHVLVQITVGVHSEGRMYGTSG